MKIVYKLFLFLTVVFWVILASQNLMAQTPDRIFRSDNKASNTKVCGIMYEEVKYYLKDATALCTWTLPDSKWSNQKDNFSTNKDTILIRFSDGAKPGRLLVVSDGATYYLDVTVIQKAKPILKIFTDSTIFCEEKQYDFKVNKDTTNYYENRLLHWITISAGGQYGPSSVSTDTKDTVAKFMADALWDKGKIQVTPFTCEGPANGYYSVSPTTLLIDTLIRLDPIPVDKRLFQLERKFDDNGTPGDFTDDRYVWVRKNINAASYACTYYSSEFNKLETNSGKAGGNILQSTGGNEIFGKGDGYVYLQAGPDVIPSGMMCRWEFNTDEFELAPMDQAPYDATNGFGVNKFRIRLKVKDQSHTSDLKIKATAYCPSCEDPLDATKYKVFYPEISLKKLDSIKDFTNFQLHSGDKLICPNQEKTFTIDYSPDELAAANATKFLLRNIPTADWDFISSTPNTATFFIKSPVSGATREYSIWIHPMNECFTNRRQVEIENGKFDTVTVNSTPAKPIMLDAKGQQIFSVTAIQANPDPLFFCNFGSTAEEVILRNASDTTVTGYVFSKLPDFFREAHDNIQIGSIKPTSNNLGRETTATFNIGAAGLDYAILPSSQVVVKARNACGISTDSAVFNVRLLDTLSVLSPIMNNGTNMADYDTLPCEASELHLRVDESQYITPGSAGAGTIYTDEVKAWWILPPDTSWRFVSDRYNDSSAKAPRIIVGSSDAFIHVRLGNKCGYGSARKSIAIRPEFMTRVSIAGNGEPCQSSVEIYKMDTTKEAQKYHWTFPKDWKVLKLNNVAVGGDTNVITVWKKDTLSGIGNKTIEIDVLVGQDSGFVYVVGINDSCGWNENNVDLHRKDSLKVLPKRHTLPPIPSENWESILCARSTIDLKLLPDDQDAEAPMSYVWHFSGPEWQVTSSTSTNDELSIVVPNLRRNKDSIYIISQRTDCSTSNKGDTLIYRFAISDTISLVGEVYDHKAATQSLSLSPCQGDTVYYIMNKSLMDTSLSALHWTWNASKDTLLGGFIDQEGGWRLLRKEHYASDTLALIVGREPVEFSVQANNICGYSKAKTFTITPLKKIADKINFIKDTLRPCNLEEITILATQNSIADAQYYQWHYPWNAASAGESVDTTDVLERKFTAAYQTGYIYVRPFNTCGFGEDSDSIFIEKVLYPPSAPIAEFGILKGDTVVDTLCLRAAIELKVKPAAGNTDTLEYHWLSANTDFLFTPSGTLSLNDSLVNLEKKNGRGSDYIWVSANTKSCSTLGDSLWIRLTAMDTIILPVSLDPLNPLSINDFIYDQRSGEKIQTKPCGSDTAIYYLDGRMDFDLRSVAFYWNGGRNVNSSDSSMDGTSWKLLDHQNFDTLKLFIGNNKADVFSIQAEVENRCGFSKMPSLRIQTVDAIVDKQSLVSKPSLYCDNETIEIKFDTIEIANDYIWHYPWKNAKGNYSDTSRLVSRTFKAHFDTGFVWLEARNGCGKNPKKSDSVEVSDIIMPPMRPDIIGRTAVLDTISDTICLRASTQYQSLRNSADKERDLVYTWFLLKGDTSALQYISDSVVSLTYTKANSQPMLAAAARDARCTASGDSVIIRIFAMDTVPLPTPSVLVDYIYDKKNNLPIQTSPCGNQLVHYYGDKSIHWSADSIHFIWDGGNVYDPTNFSMAGTDWTLMDPSMLPDSLYAKVGNTDALALQLKVHNRCGFATSDTIKLKAISVITSKPKLHLASSIVCNKEEVLLEVDSVPFAEKYVWHLPWGRKDTTQTRKHSLLETYQTGKIWVSTFNSCGGGLDSDTLEIAKVLDPMSKPIPSWRANLSIVADTVFDTICLHEKEILKLTSPFDRYDSLKLTYQWKEDAGEISLLSLDSICEITNPLSSSQTIYVSARYQECQSWGDTLFIRTQVVDTVSLASTGGINIIDPSPFDENVCPFSLITLEVDQDVSPAYLWILPDTTWKFFDTNDTKSSLVKVIVGRNMGEVKMAPITDAQRFYCSYATQSPALSVAIKPKQTLVTEELDFYEISPCVGVEAIYSVKATVGAMAYRWEFPSDWKIVNQTDNIEEAGTRECKVIAGQDSGYVYVFAVDSCDGKAIQGTRVSLKLIPSDSAKIVQIIGDRQPCRDSLAEYFIETNSFTDFFKFSYTQATGDIPVEISFPNAPSDSTLMSVVWHAKEYTDLTFSPINAQCNSGVPYTLKIKGDTVPTIQGNISGPAFVCMGSEQTYSVQVNDTSLEVDFSWELPNSSWAFAPGSDKNSPTITVIVGNYANNGVKDTIKCYPKALCGTAKPFVFELMMNFPDTIKDLVLVINNDVEPCFGTEIQLSLDGNYQEADYFIWDAPASWDPITSNLQTATAKVGSESGFVSVRYMKQGNCGPSLPAKVFITSVHIPNAARTKRLLRPCLNSENVSVRYLFDPFVERMSSQLPAEYEFQEFASRIPGDSLMIKAVGENPIPIEVSSFNKCGTKDTIIMMVPTGSLPPITETPEVQKFCLNDTAEISLELPIAHLDQGLDYRWILPENWKAVGDSLSQTLHSLYFYFANDTMRQGQINLSVFNACGALDTIHIDVAPFVFTVEAMTQEEPVFYMQDGLDLKVQNYSVGTENDYELYWFPSNRVSNTAGEWTTKELVQAVESFVVKAIEKDESACFALDTMQITVDSTFEFQVSADTLLCVGDTLFLKSFASGGNLSRYYFEWYVKEGDDYLPLIEPYFSSQDPSFLMTEDRMDIRLIAYDTTELIYNSEVLTFSKRDTQYISVENIDLKAEILRPYNKRVMMPIGDQITFEGSIDYGSGEYWYAFSPSEVFGSKDTQALEIRTAPIYNDYTVYFLVKDTLSGCVRTDSIELVLNDTFGDVPNAFTPNGDGKNDIFMKGVDLVIFNRMGMEIFKSQSKEGWDGRHKGSLVPKGDYLYIISHKTKDQKVLEKRGVVSVF